MSFLKLIFTYLIIFNSFSCSIEKIKNMNYPKTNKQNIIDFYHGKEIIDPYRWLEDDYSNETQSWVAEQNKFTDEYLNQIPFKNQIEKKLKSNWNYPTESMPIIKNGVQYYYANNGLQNQAILYKRNKNQKIGSVLIDPNKLSKDGSKALGGIYFSNDNNYLGYSLNISGSDWQELKILKLDDGSLFNEELKWVKFSGMEWFKDGFFYKKYPETTDAKKLTEVNRNSKIFYHKLNTSQKEDLEVKTLFNSEYISPWLSVSEDEELMFLYGSKGTYGNSLYFKQTSLDNNKWLPLVKDFRTEISLVRKIENSIFVLSDRKNPFNQLIKISVDKYEESSWETIIDGSKNEVLKEVQITGDKIFAHFYKDVYSLWKVFNLNGEFLYKVDAPELGIINGFSGDLSDKKTYYTFNNLITPSIIYEYDISSNTSIIYRESQSTFKSENYVISQEFYKSKDGTLIPMFICHKKGLKMDGKRPTLLYGYGGFNISIEPYFNKSNSILYDNNGVYVIANIRGGGEYGEKWHKSGILEKKQNVFDDFIYAAKYLIKKNITSPNFLGIQGQSNGGLLIGAVLNQKPDLFKVAFPEVGVMDMLRYEKFTIGYAWSVEYGSIEDENSFENILKYSPLHNIDSTVNYPSMLIYTADHDDRVIPAHSFKYAATIQSLENSKNPSLIRIGINNGHGFGKPTIKIIKEHAEKWAYFFYEMGLSY